MIRNKLLFTLLLQVFAISLFAQPVDPVTWEFSSVSKGNNQYELVFKADIDRPWHLYSSKLPEGGPIPTKPFYNENNSVEFVGEINEVIKAKVKFDEGFQMNVGTIEGKAEFRQIVKISGSSTVTLSGEIEYQVCDDVNCLPPALAEFSFTLEPTLAKEGNVAETEITPVPDAVEEEAKPVIEVEEIKDTAPGFEITGASGDDERSLWRFFWIAFGAGLLALLTPCVFPMIPMTVSFFMQGSENRARSVFRGLVFGISIMGIYTLLGLIVSLTNLGPDAANALSTHWVPNLIFFLLFIFFAFSFFGMYELVLPAKWVNKADQGADKGGLAGAFFMALTTVLVSFSCTGPIVGALLVEAAGGLALKPILGMFGFGLAFAIPFTIFAIFPSLLKGLPKSGGWLNAIKVVLGFIVLAFSMKFLLPLDPTQKILTRELVVAVWMIIFLLMGLYFLGKIKFAHDSDLPYVSVPRLLLSITAFVITLYLFMGMFGAPLKTLSPLLPSKSQGWIDLTMHGGGQAISGTVPQLECAPEKYTDMFHMPYNLTAFYDLEEGLACAAKTGKPVFIDFKGHFCSNCKKMEAAVWSDPAVQSLLRDEFIIIALYTDDRTKLPEEEWYTSEVDGKVKKTIGQQNIDYEIANFRTNTVPLYVIMDSNGKVVNKPSGTNLDVASYTSWLKEGIALAK